jgi:hypothetical protein
LRAIDSGWLSGRASLEVWNVIRIGRCPATGAGNAQKQRRNDR